MKRVVFKGPNTQVSHPAVFCHRKSKWPAHMWLCAASTFSKLKVGTLLREVALVGKLGAFESPREKGFLWMLGS